MSELIASIQCPYRTMHGSIPLCQIVAELTDFPLEFCETNDSACDYCLKCGIAPQTPNKVTASMSVNAAERMGEPHYSTIAKHMRHVLLSRFEASVETLPCVFRGVAFRQQECKPCQAGSLNVVIVPVYHCLAFQECTIRNTGTFPKIKACSTCPERTPVARTDEAPALS
jgi:hypothetical protein